MVRSIPVCQRDLWAISQVFAGPLFTDNEYECEHAIMKLCKNIDVVRFSKVDASDNRGYSRHLHAQELAISAREDI